LNEKLSETVYFDVLKSPDLFLVGFGKLFFDQDFLVKAIGWRFEFLVENT